MRRGLAKYIAFSISAALISCSFISVRASEAVSAETSEETTIETTEEETSSDTETDESDSNEDLSTVQDTSNTQSETESSVTDSDSTTQSSEETETVTTESAESQTEELTVSLFRTASGSSDISSAAVDSITIGTSQSDGSVNAYVDFTVTVNFSEDDADGNQKSGLDIESGDTITVSWTAPAGVTFTGYTETINLYQDGDSSSTLLGTAVVTDTGVTITFNDNVTNFQHVSGSVTFTIKNYGNPTSEKGGTGTITSGDVTTTVTVNHATATGIGAFGAKGGAYYTNGENKIDWWLWINGEEKSDLTGTITITDTLPDTETLDTFTSFALRNGGLWNWGVYTLDNFNSLIGSFVYDESTNTITITISESFVTESLNGTAAVLHFTTTSTAEAGTKVSNTAIYTFYENGSTTPSEETHTGSLTVPTTSGNISVVPKGTIKITKVVNGTTDPIEGVHFRVYQVVSESDTTRVSGWYDRADYAEIVTGSDGIATLSGLNDGYYEIEEIADAIPNWIDSSSLPESQYVTLGGTTGTAVTIGNDVKTGTITASKNWTESDGTTADTSTSDRTVYFQLYRDGTALTDDDLPDDQTAIQAVVTEAGESSTEVSWTNLPLYDNSGNEYTYTVKEVDADGNDYTPDGYTKTENGLTVTNKKDQEDDDDDDNDDSEESGDEEVPVTWWVSARKAWSGDSEEVRPDHITVALYQDGQQYETATLSESNQWYHKFQYLPENHTYTVKELTVPSGYTSTVTHNKNVWVITNTYNGENPETPSTPENTGTEGTSSASGTTTENPAAPQTGDDSVMGLWLVLMAASGAALAAVIYRHKRGQQN